MISCRKDTQKNYKSVMLLRLFIIELEKLCSSCFLVEKYAKKRLECLGNVGWYINHGLSDKHLRAARFLCG